MGSGGLDQLIGQADRLSAADQLRLIAHLVERVRRSYAESAPRRSWGEIAGAAPYPLLGEDAQAWVSRTRREDEEHRGRSLAVRP